MIYASGIVVSFGFTLSYLIYENLCFLTLTEKNMPKRVIFAFLEDVKTSFLNYVQSENGTEFGLVFPLIL